MSARLRAGVAAIGLCCLFTWAGASAPASTPPAHRTPASHHATKRKACARHAGHRARRAHRSVRCRRRHRHAGARSLTSSPAPSTLVAPLAGAIAGEAAPTPAPAASASGAQTVAAPGPGEGAAPAEPPPAEPPSIPHVQVSAAEYSFSLSRPSVPAGKVVLEFVNDGQDEHNLNVAEPEEGALVASFANTPSKGIGDVEVEMRAGEYTLFCSLPHHEERGMKATLVVE